MEHDYSFQFENIVLKPLLISDIEKLRILRNKEKQYFATQDEITAEAQEKWYQHYLTKDNDIMFKIEKRDQPEVFIGAIALYDIDWKRKVSECGRTVVDKELAPEKGIGLTATKAVCQFGFEILKLEKIIGEVLKTNQRIIKVDTRAGFYIVGENDEFYNIEMTAKSINIEKRKTIYDYQVNEKASITVTVTNKTVEDLAAVSGDKNPIHLDDKYAENSPFGKRIVHGLFCTGMISNVIGNILPGSGAILLKQVFEYCRPVYIGDTITAVVEVTEIKEQKKKMILKHACINQENIIVLEGTSVVKLY